MSSLDGHNFSDFGMIDGQLSDSNICLAGAWDMPARTGKTHHEWAEVFEPYLREDEIFFSGIDLYYVFLVVAQNKTEALEKVYSLYDLLGSFDELKTLSIDGLGSYEVYVKNEIKVEYLGNGYCRGTLVFRLPVIEMPFIDLAPNNISPSIDGIGFGQFGIIVLDSDGEFNRPAIKEGKTAVYGREGYSIGKQSFRNIRLKLAIQQPNYSAFSNAINTLRGLLAFPNARVLAMDGYLRECYAKDGFKVTNIYTQGAVFIAQIELNLTEIRVLTDYTLFSDASGNILTDGNGVPLSEIFKQQ